MKFQSLLFCLLVPTVVLAQDYQQMNPEDMQKMMGQMQKMQACMQGVNQADLEAFGKRGEQVEREVRTMCANGQRDAAQEKAMAFGREVQQNQAMQKMAKCGEMMAGMMPKMPFMEQVEQNSASSRHICDN